MHLDSSRVNGVLGAKSSAVAVSGAASDLAVGAVVESAVKLVAEALGTIGPGIAVASREASTRTTGRTNTRRAHGSSVRLACDGRCLGKASRRLGGTDTEDWGLPLLTLGSKLLVFGSLT